MPEKSLLLRQMRKHAQSFSSALAQPKVVDEANLKYALKLIDLSTKDTSFGSIQKLAFKTPQFLKALQLENNLAFLKTEFNKRITSVSRHSIYLSEDQQKKESDKVKRAEKKLCKILGTKDC